MSDVEGPLDFFAIDAARTITPHSDGNIGASSLYEASDDYPPEKYVQQKISVDSVTLAGWAARSGVDAIDLIWMDLQGAELRALQGMRELIRTVQVIYTEVEYKPIYRNQPLADEVRAFLRNNGFSLRSKLNTSEWFGNELYCNRKTLRWWRRVLA